MTLYEYLLYNLTYDSLTNEEFEVIISTFFCQRKNIV